MCALNKNKAGVRPSPQGGFSLVETVTALGILALAALPLMEVASDAASNTRMLEQRMLARTVAENVLARTMAEVDPHDGGIETGQEVQLGRTFMWTLNAGPSVPGQLQPLEVSVTYDQDAQVLAQISALKRVRPIIEVGAPIEAAQ